MDPDPYQDVTDLQHCLPNFLSNLGNYPQFFKTVAYNMNWFRLEVKQCGHGPDDYAMLHRLLYGGQRFSKVQVN